MTTLNSINFIFVAGHSKSCYLFLADQETLRFQESKRREIRILVTGIVWKKYIIFLPTCSPCSPIGPGGPGGPVGPFENKKVK